MSTTALEVYFAGEEAVTWFGTAGAKTDDQILTQARNIAESLGTFSGTVSTLTTSKVSHWMNTAYDAYARGSFSYVKTGATASMRDALYAPVGGALYFAGEATHNLYPGTLHGAALSGLSAADDIMNFPVVSSYLPAPPFMPPVIMDVAVSTNISYSLNITNADIAPQAKAIGKALCGSVSDRVHPGAMM